MEYKNAGTDHFLIEATKNQSNEYDIPSDWKFLRHQPSEVGVAAMVLAVENEQLLYEVKRAWLQFLDDFNKISTEFQSFIAVLSQFDCLYALSVLAANSNYAIPQIVEEGDRTLQVVEGRHPSLEARIAENGGRFVSNDIDLNERMAQMVITGPNMNGKSVYMKMIALLIIMAQIGSFVPAESMRLTPFDMVGTRIGIYDNIKHGKSTFFVEMSECAQLIASATSKSFLILDEIGRGTSTFDGTSMAYSILKHIAESVRCMTLFVTHYAELLELQEEFEGVIANYFMSFAENENGIECLYIKIEEGRMQTIIRHSSGKKERNFGENNRCSTAIL